MQRGCVAEAKAKDGPETKFWKRILDGRREERRWKMEEREGMHLLKQKVDPMQRQKEASARVMRLPSLRCQ
jgi:hypothetical protein